MAATRTAETARTPARSPGRQPDAIERGFMGANQPRSAGDNDALRRTLGGARTHAYVTFVPFERPHGLESSGSAEGKAIGLGARAEELDLDEALADRAGLADQLMEALLGQRAVASLVDVEPMAVTGR